MKQNQEAEKAACQWYADHLRRAAMKLRRAEGLQDAQAWSSGRFLEILATAFESGRIKPAVHDGRGRPKGPLLHFEERLAVAGFIQSHRERSLEDRYDKAAEEFHISRRTAERCWRELGEVVAMPPGPAKEQATFWKFHAAMEALAPSARK